MFAGYDSSAPTGLNAAAKGVKARVFQGGNHWDLHKMLEVKSGSEVGGERNDQLGITLTR